MSVERRPTDRSLLAACGGDEREYARRYKEKHGREGGWRFYVAYTDEAGQRKYRATTAKTAKEARRLEAEIGVEMERRRLGLSEASPNPNRWTLWQMCEWCYRTHWQDTSGGPSYLQRLERFVRDDRAGALPAEAFTTGAATELLARVRRRVSPATTNRVRAALHTVFERAIKSGHWRRINPMKNTERLVEAQHAWTILSPDEAQRLLAAMPEPEALFFAFLWYTGARRGEASGLRWEDVDLGSGTITIARSYDGTTKSKRVRRVPIHGALVDVLRRAWGIAVARGGAHIDAHGRPVGLVFPTSTGGMRIKGGASSESVALKRAVQAIGFHRRLRIHDVRHSTATQLLRAGAGLRQTQGLLGHSSATVTERYLHLLPEDLRADLDRLPSLPPRSDDDA